MKARELDYAHSFETSRDSEYLIAYSVFENYYYMQNRSFATTDVHSSRTLINRPDQMDYAGIAGQSTSYGISDPSAYCSTFSTQISSDPSYDYELCQKNKESFEKKSKDEESMLLELERKRKIQRLTKDSSRSISGCTVNVIDAHQSSESSSIDYLDSELTQGIDDTEKQYHLLMEAIGHSPVNFFRMVRFLISLYNMYQILQPNTLNLAVELLVKFSTKQDQLDLRVEENMKLAAGLALFVASKFEDGKSLNLELMLNQIRHGSHPYPAKLFLRAEMIFCHLIDFEVWQDTRFTEALRILKEENLCLVEFEVAKSCSHIEKRYHGGYGWRNSVDELNIGYLVRYLVEASLYTVESFVYTTLENAVAVVKIAKHSLGYSSMSCENERIRNLCQILHSAARSLSVNGDYSSCLHCHVSHPLDVTFDDRYDSDISAQNNFVYWLFKTDSMIPDELHFVEEHPSEDLDEIESNESSVLLLSTPTSTSSSITVSSVVSAVSDTHTITPLNIE